jgi:hypothetical protein
MQDMQEMQPYNAGLPTTDQVAKNYSSFLSDHSMIMAKIPGKELGLGENSELLIETVNWMELNNAAGGSGGAPLGKNCNEVTDQEENARHTQRIPDAIKQSHTQHSSDFKTYQEINDGVDGKLFKPIQSAITTVDPNVVCATEDGKEPLDIGRNFTFYNKAKFTQDLNQPMGKNSFFQGGITRYFVNDPNTFRLQICDAPPQDTDLQPEVLYFYMEKEGEQDVIKCRTHNKVPLVLKRLDAQFLADYQAALNEPNKVEHSQALSALQIFADYQAALNEPNKVERREALSALQKDDKFEDAVFALTGTYASRKKTIAILNAHAVFRDTSEEHQKQLEKVLVEMSKRNDVSVIIGDFNTHVGESHNLAEILNATNIVQPELQKYKIQGGYCYDTAFILCGKNKTAADIDQARVEHINPKTGKYYTAEERKVPDLATLSPAQRDEFLRFRPIISIAKYYRTTPFIHFADENLPAQTLSEYERDLNTQWKKDFPENTESFKAYAANNLCNHQGVSIQIPRSLVDYFKTHSSPDVKLEVLDKKLGPALFRESIPNAYENTLVDREPHEIKYFVTASLEHVKELTSKIAHGLSEKAPLPIEQENTSESQKIFTKGNAIAQKKERLSSDDKKNLKIFRVQYVKQKRNEFDALKSANDMDGLKRFVSDLHSEITDKNNQFINRPRETAIGRTTTHKELEKLASEAKKYHKGYEKENNALKKMLEDLAKATNNKSVDAISFSPTFSKKYRDLNKTLYVDPPSDKPLDKKTLLKELLDFLDDFKAVNIEGKKGKTISVDFEAIDPTVPKQVRRLIEALDPKFTRTHTHLAFDTKEGTLTIRGDKVAEIERWIKKERDKGNANLADTSFTVLPNLDGLAPLSFLGNRARCLKFEPTTNTRKRVVYEGLLDSLVKGGYITENIKMQVMVSVNKKFQNVEDQISLAPGGSKSGSNG